MSEQDSTPEGAPNAFTFPITDGIGIDSRVTVRFFEPTTSPPDPSMEAVQAPTLEERRTCVHRALMDTQAFLESRGAFDEGFVEGDLDDIPPDEVDWDTWVHTFIPFLRDGLHGSLLGLIHHDPQLQSWLEEISTHEGVRSWLENMEILPIPSGKQFRPEVDMLTAERELRIESQDKIMLRWCLQSRATGESVDVSSTHPIFVCSCPDFRPGGNLHPLSLATHIAEEFSLSELARGELS